MPKSQSKPKRMPREPIKSRLAGDIQDLLQALEGETLSPAGKQAVQKFERALQRGRGMPRVPLTEAQVRADLAAGLTQVEIAQKHGVAINTVRRRLGQKN